MSFEIKDGVLKKYYEENGETAVVIPDSVTTIENNAFANCLNLESVTIPNSVTNIEYGAFYGCKRLESITIPDSITRIENLVFSCCENLESITIPESVTSIGLWAFSNTKWLENYPDDLVIINGILIRYKGNSKNVLIPDNVTSIGTMAFDCCKNLESITIPDSVTSIGDFAFAHCSCLESITYKGIKAKLSLIIPTSSFTKHNRYGYINNIIETINKKDFSAKIPNETKYGIACSLFNQNPADPETYAYFKKNFFKIFRFAIDNNDIETVNNVIKEDKLITKRNIDKLIGYAEQKNNTAIKNILENYKNQL